MPVPCPGHDRGTVMRARALKLALCLSTLACPQVGNNQATIAQGGNVRETIDAWLLCQECTDGELDSLVALETLLPGATVDNLSTDLLAGPSSTRRTNIEQQLAGSFAEDSAYDVAEGVTPTLSSVDYIQIYRGNYVAVYRSRAAIALGRIGGARAGAALDSAVAGQLRQSSDSLRSDVKQDVQFARDSLWTP
jgi:hypothetical protein